MYGNFKIESINIDEDAFDADNKDMVEETIAICINELLEEIREAEAEINNKITGSPNGGGLF
jgi:DNA-binding protein YbaB